MHGILAGCAFCAWFLVRCCIGAHSTRCATVANLRKNERAIRWELACGDSTRFHQLLPNRRASTCVFEQRQILISDDSHRNRWCKSLRCRRHSFRHRTRQIWNHNFGRSSRLRWAMLNNPVHAACSSTGLKFSRINHTATRFFATGITVADRQAACLGCGPRRAYLPLVARRCCNKQLGDTTFVFRQYFHALRRVYITLIITRHNYKTGMCTETLEACKYIHQRQIRR